MHGELAAELGAPSSVFFRTRSKRAQLEKRREITSAESLRQVAERMPDEVCVALETHGDFARTEATVEIVALVNHPRVKLIWDVANSVAAGDSIAVAGQTVQRFSVTFTCEMHGLWPRPNTGCRSWPAPVKFLLRKRSAVIEELNYDGYVSFEWEKYWHPEIEEPEVALPDFINAIRKLQ